jgi:hypothetical protein
MANNSILVYSRTAVSPVQDDDRYAATEADGNRMRRAIGKEREIERAGTQHAKKENMLFVSLLAAMTAYRLLKMQSARWDTMRRSVKIRQASQTAVLLLDIKP